jgi:hypothetical protein
MHPYRLWDEQSHQHAQEIGAWPGRIGALFSLKIFYKIDTIIFSFVFDKYYSIMD